MRWIVISAFLVSFILNGGTQAQPAWPSKQVNVISSGTAGGSADLMVRMITEPLSAKLGRAFIVEVKPGAGGHIANVANARAPADGYHFGVNTGGMTIMNPLLEPDKLKQLNLNPIEDFEFIARIFVQPTVIFVRKDSNIQTFKELIEKARAEPGKLKYAALGRASTTHLAGLALEKRTGIKMTMVPYDGSNDLHLSVLRGDVDVGIDWVGAVLATQYKAGTIRPLAITSTKRSQYFPDVATVDEQGYPGFDIVTWTGFAAPAGTPKEAADRFAEELKVVISDPEVLKKLSTTNTEVSFLPREEYRKFILEELKKWTATIAEINLN